MRSEEESPPEGLTEKGGAVEWLKERLAETQPELDSAKNEAEGLRRLNSARSGSVSSVSSAWASSHRTQLAQPRFLRSLGLQRPDMGLHITGSRIGR